MDRLSKDRIRDILRSAQDVRVLVVGDLMLDRYLTGEVDRISPEAPVPVVHVSGESSAVGGAGNVAANVVGLGAGCDIVGCIGDDLEGRLLLEELAELGVETEGVVVCPDRPTTVKTRVLARRQQVVRVDREEAADVSDDIAGRLLEQVESRAAVSRAIGLQDYNKGVLVSELIGGALEAARSAACPVVVDPKAAIAASSSTWAPPSSSPMRRNWRTRWASGSSPTIRSGWRELGHTFAATHSS